MPRTVSASARELAASRLREFIQPNDQIFTLLEHTSASGMSRAIRVLVPRVDIVCAVCGRDRDSVGGPCHPPDCFGASTRYSVSFTHPNRAIADLLGLRHHIHKGQRSDALVIHGCGFDAGRDLVDRISRALNMKLRQEWI